MFIGVIFILKKDTILKDKKTGKIYKDSILTHLLGQHYNFPTAFGEMSDQFSDLDNCRLLYKDFENRLEGNTDTSALLMIFGDDFFYQTEDDFKKLDLTQKCIEFLKSDPSLLPNTEIKWARADEYFQRLRQDQKIKKEEIRIRDKTNEDWYVLREDKNPIAPRGGNWAGYYVARQLAKKLMRNLGLVIRKLKNFVVTEFGEEKIRLSGDWSEADFLIGVMTHHDAMTGTARDFVNKDYMDLIQKMKEKLETGFLEVFQPILEKLNLSQEDVRILQISGFDEEQYIKIPREQSQQGANLLLIKNFFSKKNQKKRKITFETHSKQKFHLQDQNGSKYTGEYTCDYHLPSPFCHYEFELDLSPQELKFLKMRPTGHPRTEHLFEMLELAASPLEVNGEIWEVELKEGAFLAKKKDGEFLFEISWMEYTGIADPSREVPGNYMMNLGKIGENIPKRIKMKNISLIKKTEKYILRVYGEKRLRVTDIIIKKNFKGPIIIETVHRIDKELAKKLAADFENYEYFIRYKTGLKSERRFATDLNGLRMSQRQFGVIPGYSSHADLIESFVYPVTSLTHSKSENGEFGVRVDRPTAATMSEDGCLDIWLKRIAAQEDHKGNEDRLMELETISVHQQLYIKKNYENKEKKLLSSENFEKIPKINPLLDPDYDLLDLMKEDLLSDELAPQIFTLAFRRDFDVEKLENWSFGEEHFVEEWQNLVKVTYDLNEKTEELVITFTNLREEKAAFVKNLKEKIYGIYSEKADLEIKEVQANNIDILEGDKWDGGDLELGPLSFRTFRIRIL